MCVFEKILIAISACFKHLFEQILFCNQKKRTYKMRSLKMHFSHNIALIFCDYYMFTNKRIHCIFSLCFFSFLTSAQSAFLYNLHFSNIKMGQAYCWYVKINTNSIILYSLNFHKNCSLFYCRKFVTSCEQYLDFICRIFRQLCFENDVKNAHFKSLIILKHLTRLGYKLDVNHK